jgi:hypothetical protein
VPAPSASELVAGYEVLSVAFSPEGLFLATGGADSTVRICSVEDGQELSVWRGPEKRTPASRRGHGSSSPSSRRVRAGRRKRANRWRRSSIKSGIAADTLATRMRRLVGNQVEILTRAQAESAKGYNARVARKWFALYPELRVVLVGYLTITALGLKYMPIGETGQRRMTTPRPTDPTSPVLYHRKGRGYNTNFVAFIHVA